MRFDHWHVAQTLSRAEPLAERHLTRQGFLSFCPRFAKLRRHARRVDQVLTPLFPGYLFVRFDPERDQWRCINGTYGVSRLVGPPGGMPQAMPTNAMEALFDRCAQGLVRQILPAFTPGQQVRLIAGPFADQLVTIEALDAKQRVRVLLDILGQQRPVSVAVGDLAPA